MSVEAVLFYVCAWMCVCVYTYIYMCGVCVPVRKSIEQWRECLFLRVIGSSLSVTRNLGRLELAFLPQACSLRYWGSLSGVFGVRV